jgi:hypothetical protein
MNKEMKDDEVEDLRFTLADVASVAMPIAVVCVILAIGFVVGYVI